MDSGPTTSAYSRRRVSAPQIGSTIGDYELRQVVRSDGAATVFAAYHATLRREVELRVLRGELVADDPEARRRFREGARMMAGLEHPGVTPIYGFGESEDTAWTAPRRLHAPSLADDVRAGRVTGRHTVAVIEEL